MFCLLNFVERFIPDMKLNGKVYQGTCIFHLDNSPSFTVYQDKQDFYCYGCKVGGDIIDFLALQFGYDYKEAREYLRLNY